MPSPLVFSFGVFDDAAFVCSVLNSPLNRASSRDFFVFLFVYVDPFTSFSLPIGAFFLGTLFLPLRTAVEPFPSGNPLSFFVQAR